MKIAGGKHEVVWRDQFTPDCDPRSRNETSGLPSDRIDSVFIKPYFFS